MEAVAVVGDIHGNVRALEKALAWMSSWPAKVVFAGDYVNRGPFSREVLDLMVAFGSDLGERVTFLAGNHDLALLNFVRGQDEAKFLAHAGLTTLHSYLGSNVGANPFTEFRHAFPPSHRRFLERLAPYWESADMIISHSGINPQRPDSRLDEDVVYGSHPTLFDPDIVLPKMVVAGHYAQRQGLPYIADSFACIDTGSGTIPGAPLCVMTFPTRAYYTFKGQHD
ncbi:metallophosphoesterase [Leifsonia sp. NPDC014704]|uniref:metallophosphoesterase n=1 Tax=Leifsonia sp. NPDC014704 TaxID=3364123 RepID=UPI0036F46160